MLNTRKSFLRPDWKKGTVSLIVSAVLAVTCFSQAPKKCLLLILMCLLAGFLKLNIPQKWLRFSLEGLISLVCAAVTCCLPTIFLNEIGFNRSITDQVLWTGEVFGFNLLCVFIVCLLLFPILGRWRTSMTFGTFALGVLSLISGFVFQFRGREMMFIDIFSIGTAVNVAGQYSYRLEPIMYFWIGIWALTVLALYAVSGSGQTASRKTRFAALGAELLLILSLVLGTADLHAWTWECKGNMINGFYLNFYLGFRDSSVQSPENYSPEAVDLVSQKYGDAGQTVPEELPNIIIIMNEAFADFRNLDSDLRTNQPVMPFFDSLTENVIRGRAAASIFGGNTANSEFEVLTGHSMAFLPDGSIPYQLYMKEPLFSLPWLMSSLGYDTFATHPYLSSGWSRTTAYPLMGFDAYSFREDYPDPEYIRNFISDREMYRYLLDKLDSRGSNPLFLFGITVQNHSDYNYTGDRYTQTIELTELEGYPAAEQYLSLIHESDKALEYLLTELEARQEKTLVLFFGDHYPKVETAFYETLQADEPAGLAKDMQTYLVPFLIWANYDIPEQTVDHTSLNYLGRYLLEAAGIPLPPFYQFLKEMEEFIPTVNALGYFSADAQAYLPLSEASGEEARWLDTYAMLLYNNMFDSENQNLTFFGQYLPRN